MLHFYVQRFFAPVILSGYIRNNSIHVNLVRDHVETSHNSKWMCNISLHDWRKFDIQWNEVISVDILPSKHSVC